MRQRIFNKLLAIAIIRIIANTERLDITTKALKALWKIKKFKLIWPSVINAAISFFNDCINECSKARKWYTEY